MKHIKVIEPRVNIREDTEKTHFVLQGGLRVTENVFPADSYGSNFTQPIQATWTINPPSTQTIVDSFIRTRLYIQVVTDQPVTLGTNSALCQFPINTMTDVLTTTINGTSLTDNVSDKLHAMLCYGYRQDCRNKSTSCSTVMPDMYQNYGDWLVPSIGGSAKNPLSAYGENSAEDPRGGFTYVPLAGNLGFQAIVTEPLFMSPYNSGFGEQGEGFVNVNQMNFIYRWKTNLSHILSQVNPIGTPNPVTNVQVTFFQQPELLITFITPDLTQKIPRLQILPYYKSLDYAKSFMVTIPPLSPGPIPTVQMISDTFKLAQIPRKMFIFVRHNRSTQYDQLTSDSFLSIQNMSVLWNNQNSLFNAASPQQLYEMSRRNGLNLTFSQFTTYRGSIICVEFSKDIGLLDNESPGVAGQYTLQVTLQVYNPQLISNPYATSYINPELFVCFLLEGTLSIAENMARTSLGNLTPDDVIRAKQSHEEVSYSVYENLQGGGFWQNLKNFVHRLSSGISGAAGLISKASPAIVAAFPELAPFAAIPGAVSSAAGYVRDITGKGMVGGRRHHRMHHGSGMVGGEYYHGGEANNDRHGLHLGDAYEDGGNRGGGPVGGASYYGSGYQHHRGKGIVGGARRHKSKSHGGGMVGGKRHKSKSHKSKSHRRKSKSLMIGGKRKSKKKGGALVSTAGGIMKRRKMK